MTDYSAAAGSYDNTRTSDDIIIGLLSKKGLFQKGRRVLDFGCGTGNYLAKIASRYDCELFGIEPNDEMRERAIAKNPKTRIESGDHANIPFAAEFFDLVYMTDVIHHVRDLGLLFANIVRVLKKPGLVCVVTNSWAQIEARWYNRYFPSLCENEKARYPDIDRIVAIAKEGGLCEAGIDLKDSSGPWPVDESFLRMTREKNYSMFRMLSDEEFSAGYAAMERDKGLGWDSPGAGESLVWLKRN